MTTRNSASASDQMPLKTSDPLEMLSLANAPIAVHYLVAFIMTALATVVTVGIDHEVAIPNLSLIYVLPVITTAVLFGLAPSLFSAVLGALAYNFFLTEPRYTLVVNDPANILAIGLLFVVGCIASAVASTARREADDVALLKRQMQLLHAYTRQVANAQDAKQAVFVTVNALEGLFHASVIVALMSETTVDFVERRGKIAPTDADLEAARLSVTTERMVVAGIYPGEASRFDFWPVKMSAGKGAVIGLAFEPQQRPSAPGILAETIATHLGLVLECQHFHATNRLERS